MQYIITESAVTVVVGGRPPITVDRSDSRYEDVLLILKDPALADSIKEARIIQLADITSILNDYISGDVRIEGGALKYKGKTLPQEMYLVKRILDMRAKGLPVDPMIRFLERVMQNPSYRARTELLQFMEYGNLPITSDGHFMAYKKVRHDYKDIYTGEIDNSIGAEPKMDRAEVDDDPTFTCSKGLHACSFDYLRLYGSENHESDRVVVVKIDPADVVAVPKDYNNTKMRICRYVVVDELGEVKDILPDTIIYDRIDEGDDVVDEGDWDDPTQLNYIVEHAKHPGLYLCKENYSAPHTWVEDADLATQFKSVEEAERDFLGGIGIIRLVNADTNQTYS